MTRRLWAALAATLVLVAGCGGGAPLSAQSASPHVQVTARALSGPNPKGWFRVVVTEPTEVLTEPHGKVLRLVGTETSQRSPMMLLVMGQSGEWIKVMLQGRPDGQIGWIRQGQRGTRLEVGHGWIVIRTAKHEVIMTTPDGETVRSKVVVGKPSAATPKTVGTVTYVTDRIKNPPALGTFALGLAIRSGVYTEFGNGDGQVAIHGWPEDRQEIFKSKNLEQSHGCIRLPAEVEKWLPRFLIGTPVVIE